MKARVSKLRNTHCRLAVDGRYRAVPRCGCVLVMLWLLVGCGGGDGLRRQAISGTVTLDGAPVQQGTISFDPESLEAVTSSGAVIVAGEFSIPRDVGLPPGSYRVRINVPQPGEDTPEDNTTMPGEAGPIPVELAPPEWNSRSTQTIEVTTDGPFVFEFEM